MAAGWFGKATLGNNMWDSMQIHKDVQGPTTLCLLPWYLYILQTERVLAFSFLPVRTFCSGNRGEQKAVGLKEFHTTHCVLQSRHHYNSQEIPDLTLWLSTLAVLTQPFRGAHVGTLLHKSRRIRRTITHDFSPFALA